MSEPLGKKLDIEAMLARVEINLFFGAGQEVEEQGTDSGTLQSSCNEDVT